MWIVEYVAHAKLPKMKKKIFYLNSDGIIIKSLQMDETGAVLSRPSLHMVVLK